MTDWQPMDTAPKDGRRILICDSDGHVSAAVWEAADDGSPSGWFLASPYGGGAAWEDEGRRFVVFPERWMPVPSTERGAVA
jgi:hypothetical protein